MHLKFIRVGFALLTVLSTRLAGRIAVSIFYSPRRFPAAKWEADCLQAGSTQTYPFNGGQLVATIWGSGPDTVLLVHGWEGRRSQMGKLGGKLAMMGYRAVAIDGPAHGASIQKRTTLVEFSQAVKAAVQCFGPIHSIVGHSFGAAASAIAIQDGVPATRVVLISCPWSLRHVVGGFARFVGLPSRAHEAMYPLMQKLHGCPESALSFESIGPRIHIPVLLVHDQNDRYIPLADGERVHGLIEGSTMVATTGLGHMRILQDDAVISKVASFVRNLDTKMAA
jgi:pimeloyl-ACP methyl ester carboxylesterase